MSTDRLPVQFIDIRSTAVDLVISAIRESGLDPAKCIHNQMIRQLAIAYRNLEMDRAQFIRSCRNVGILNGSLK